MFAPKKSSGDKLSSLKECLAAWEKGKISISCVLMVSLCPYLMLLTKLLSENLFLSSSGGVPWSRVHVSYSQQTIGTFIYHLLHYSGGFSMSVHCQRSDLTTFCNGVPIVFVGFRPGINGTKS